MAREIHVAIRSYRRAGEVLTLKHAPYAKVWVPESQGDAYREHYGDSVITIPDDEDGNAAKKFNAILNRAPAPWVVVLDDDIFGIGMWEDGVRSWLDPDDIWCMIEHHFELAEQLGVHLWGINQNMDPMLYDIYRPFNLLAPVLGPFTGHLEPELRYDERLPKGNKEDYDFWLQNIHRHRRTLRANKYHYNHDHGTKPGGFVSMRSMDVERDAVQFMREKWGDQVFRMGGSAGGRNASGKNILNSKIRCPIPGI